MASSSVFGKPVTSRDKFDKAQKAYNHPNTDGKHDEALAYLNKEKVNSASDATRGNFYNATGEDLIYVVPSGNNSFYGKFGTTSPPIVFNGQWGAFVHLKSPDMPSRSVGYVLYRGKDSATVYLLGWSTPEDLAKQNNKAYCFICDDKSIPLNDVIYNKLESSGTQCIAQKDGQVTTAKIDANASSPVFEAQLTWGYPCAS